MYNWYAAPQLFEMTDRNYNTRVVGKFRANRKVFDSEKLLLDKNVMETFKILVDKRLGVGITT